MKVLVSRISKGEVLVSGKQISLVSKGIVLFVGFDKGDSFVSLESIAKKVFNLRIFENDKGKLHYSVKDKAYQILCISNFTLCANTKKGNRPSFDDAMSPDQASKLFEEFVELLKSKKIDVQTGMFGQHMDININMDGPINIVLDS
ncbi:MAG: D-tyrosyl-tRNA(Tyr) deacylase [Candidatus Omnitrophica bacterium]|nr:D-tyrosyl-tRNA(Tyr) deacylase [Candidatus Omnitrophota bacterium]MCK5288581.1 D-tyrosyl-tRNA(Tyr) deacylase [Candidatus Omnitrophota bacterium]